MGQGRNGWRWGLLLGLILYAGWLTVAYEFHFIDRVNLAFHEAGHLFLGPFGETAHFLGGTIGQLFFPAAISIHFWRRGQRFEAGIGGVWFSESLMYAAEYMGDANARVLPLVGGGVHDWHFLFSRWGLLESAESIAGFVHFLACLLLIASLVWMYRHRDFHPGEEHVHP